MHKQCAVCGRNFNSRPSARGDGTAAALYEWVEISIPAPPRGATCWGVIRMFTKIFQFPPLREGRRMRLRRGWGAVNISIPAPPRGATGAGRIAAPMSKDFNSRPSARGDTAAGRGITRLTIFQFPPLREGRLISE